MEKYADSLELLTIQNGKNYILAIEEANVAFAEYKPLHPNDKPNISMKVQVYEKMAETELRIAMINKVEKRDSTKKNFSNKPNNFTLLH